MDVLKIMNELISNHGSILGYILLGISTLGYAVF